MMLDVLADEARKDYEDRRRRQAEGQGRYKGRPENLKRNQAIAAMLAPGASWSEVQHAAG